MKTVERVISGHASTSTERITKKDASVEGYWNVLKGVLLEATGRNCRRTKCQSRYKETWWSNDDVSNTGSVKYRRSGGQQR